MRPLFLTAALLLCAATLFAQGSIRGRLTDSSTGSPLSLATVTVFKAADTALVTYRLSTSEGDFRVPGIPLHVRHRVVISFSGYEVYRREFTLGDDAPLDMGTVKMLPASQSLDEVLVIAERPPVTVRRDTIEFNATSFRTLPTALVEDLLRKLPGVQVDREGNITANGRRVNRIMVDGKNFFGDDPKMATRNLPANVIDKIQVTEDKDEAARNTDGDLTNVGQVINLTLKKGVKKGWFGKAYAGAGTRERYEVGGIANIYRDTMQLSVLGFSNNVNRSGFSMRDVQDLGGFNRSGFNSLMVSRRGGTEGFAINGISFGGLDAGIARTTGGGFNLNHAPSKKKTFFLQYFYGSNRNILEETNNTEQFLRDTAINTRTETDNRKLAGSHNVSLGTTLKPDSLTDINFRAGYVYTTVDEDINALIHVANNKRGRLSSGAGKLFNNTYGNDLNENLSIVRRFRAKKGRVLNLFNSVSYRSNLQQFITESQNRFFYPSDSLGIFEQLRRPDVNTLSVIGSLNYNEPLSKNWTFRFNNRFDFLHDEQEIGIFSKDGSSAKYEVMDDVRSSGFERKQHRFSSGVSLSYKLKQVMLTGGVQGLWQQIDNGFRNKGREVRMNLFNVLPSFSLTRKQFSLRFDQNVTVPSINYLIPVPDSSNPYFIRFGNPDLKPAKRSSVYLNNFQFMQGSGTSYNFYINANYTDNDVIMSRTVESKGVQKVVPVNADGTLQFYAGLGFGKEFKKNQKFIYSFRLSPYVNFNRSKLMVNGNTGIATTMQYGPTLSVGLNWNDIVEFRPEYRPGISFTSYTEPSFRDIRAVSQNLEGELIVRWPKKIVWETNVAYRSTSDVPPGLPKDNLLWNAAVTLLMLKDSKGLLKLSVYDLLNRNNYLYRYTTQNQIVDQQTNVLKRFAQLTFTYNIRNMGAPKKVGGRDRLFMF